MPKESYALQGQSFHSVKGGVGRTHLAVQTALEACRKDPARPVYLIDMDLTGTSLADWLPIYAPRWKDWTAKPTAKILATTPPDSYWRLCPEEDAKLYLNDYLLFQTPDWVNETDCKIEAVSWKYGFECESCSNLRVLPSSAVPEDIQRILPVINDEEHAAFLESRMEHLLAAILRQHPGQTPFVVFDCPRGIYGVSRSIMSLGLRLSHEPKHSLAQDGGMPDPLEDAKITWDTCLVVGDDIQDVLATNRWLALAQPSERIRRIRNSPRGVEY